MEAMFSKQITFFALSIFFLSNFGKLINYAFCKVAVYQETNSFVCDCEKLLYSLPPDGNADRQPPSMISMHSLTPELFHHWHAHCTLDVPEIPDTSWRLEASTPLYHRFRNAVFRPPLVHA